MVKECDMLVDLHTGSFYRTNMPSQVSRHDNPQVVILSSCSARSRC
ncbi:MAG: hypothetical protein R3E50_14515 [Halioglobus sp.]